MLYQHGTGDTWDPRFSGGLFWNFRVIIVKINSKIKCVNFAMQTGISDSSHHGRRLLILQRGGGGSNLKI